MYRYQVKRIGGHEMATVQSKVYYIDGHLVGR